MYQSKNMILYLKKYTMWVASPWGFSGMTIQPARHECHAYCPLQAEKPGIQPVVGNTHGTHVEQVVSSFQKIRRGSQLAWYMESGRWLAMLMLIAKVGSRSTRVCRRLQGVTSYDTYSNNKHFYVKCSNVVVDWSRTEYESETCDL